MGRWTMILQRIPKGFNFIDLGCNPRETEKVEKRLTEQGLRDRSGNTFWRNGKKIATYSPI